MPLVAERAPARVFPAVVRRLSIPFALGLALFASRASAAPVAITGPIAGKKVEVQPGGKGAWQPLAPLRKLEPGDRLRCGAESRVVVILLSSKERFQVEAGGEAEVQAEGVRGGKSLGGLTGPSAATAAKLAGSRTGAFAARPAERFAPLFRGFKGWLPLDTRQFKWEPVPGAATYVFSLFDAQSNLVWQSEAVRAASADLPMEKLPLPAGRPHVWRLVPYGASGKPLPASRWGVVTFLEGEAGVELDREAEALRAQDREDPANPLPLLLLAELYRERGVLDGALETLATLQSRGGVDGIGQLLSEVYAELGPFVRGLAAGASSSD